MSDARPFTCAACGKSFPGEDGWGDQEMRREKEALWGAIPVEHCAVVCDDCFKKIVPGR